MIDGQLGDEVARKISTCYEAVELETLRLRDGMATAAMDSSLIIKAVVHHCLEDAVVDVQVATLNKFVRFLCGKLDVHNIDGLVGLAQAYVWDDPSMADAFIQQGQNIVVLAKKTSSAPPQLHQLVVATKPAQVEPVFVVRMPRFPPRSSPVNTVRSTKRVASSTAIDPPPLPKKFRCSGIELPSLVTNAAAPTSTLAVTSSPQPAPPIRPLAHGPAPEFEVAPTSTLPSATSTSPNSPRAFLRDAPGTDITVEAVAAPEELIAVPNRAVASEPIEAAKAAASEVAVEAPSEAVPNPMTQRDATTRIEEQAGANYHPKASTTAPPPPPPAICPTCGIDNRAVLQSAPSTRHNSPRAIVVDAPSAHTAVGAVVEIIVVPERAAGSEPIVAVEAAVEAAVVASDVAVEAAVVASDVAVEAPSQNLPPKTKRDAIERVAQVYGTSNQPEWYSAKAMELYSIQVDPDYARKIVLGVLRLAQNT